VQSRPPPYHPQSHTTEIKDDSKQMEKCGTEIYHKQNNYVSSKHVYNFSVKGYEQLRPARSQAFAAVYLNTAVVWDTLTFKMEPISSPETSVSNQTTLRNIP
jgi:hypothetical protein